MCSIDGACTRPRDSRGARFTRFAGTKVQILTQVTARRALTGTSSTSRNGMRWSGSASAKSTGTKVQILTEFSYKSTTLLAAASSLMMPCRVTSKRSKLTYADVCVHSRFDDAVPLGIKHDDFVFVNPPDGAHFTCFTGTTVQILTLHVASQTCWCRRATRS
jgi:hypothetical protein